MSEVMDVTETRKDIHRSISPAVFSKHARETIIPDIVYLDFPPIAILDPKALAESIYVRDELEYSQDQASDAAQESGINGIWYERGIFYQGFGDRNFTSLIAGSVGNHISNILLHFNAISEPLSLMDYGKLFQTEWFGDLMNSMALTGQGELAPALRHPTGGIPKLSKELELEDDIIVSLRDKETGLFKFVLDETAKRELRARIDRKTSVGCPVARTSFFATPEQVQFLEDHGHLETSGEEPVGSGFYKDHELAANGLIKLRQSERTAIDDVLFAWGNYITRYAIDLIDRGIDPKGIENTDAREVLLLNE